MTENLAGRGEGLAGLGKGWLQVCDKIMAGKGAAKADAEDLAYADGLRHCAADLKVALEAAAPPSTAPTLNLEQLRWLEQLRDEARAIAKGRRDCEWANYRANMADEVLAALATPSPQTPVDILAELDHEKYTGPMGKVMQARPAATQEQPAGSKSADADTGFHAQDGWMFKRMEDGSVRILRGKVFVVLPENSWASVVCSVSKLGETHSRWQEIRFFHGTESVRRWNGHAQKWEWV